MPGKKVTCYTCCGLRQVRRDDGRWVSCNSCGGSGQVSTR